MKLYREVKTSERLPEEDTKVNTDVGYAEYCSNDNWIADYPDGGFVFGQNVVKWWLEEVDVTKIIEEVEDLHPYKQSGDRDSYSDYSQGWADACDVVLSRLEN